MNLRAANIPFSLNSPNKKHRETTISFELRLREKENPKEAGKQSIKTKRQPGPTPLPRGYLVYYVVSNYGE